MEPLSVLSLSILISDRSCGGGYSTPSIIMFVVVFLPCALVELAAARLCHVGVGQRGGFDVSDHDARRVRSLQKPQNFASTHP